MRLSVRRFRPDALFDSFLGLLDIKLGCEIVLLFGLINKVAGLYGLITIFVGGSFTQLSYYAYSTATLFAFLWALKIVKSEHAKTTLLVSHLYLIDHLLLSLFHYLFYLNYWYTIPHDGRRTTNSQAQQDLIDLAVSRGEITDPRKESGEGRVALAQDIWAHERSYALGVLVLGFVLKIYFILLLYSYAAHLRSPTYHSLPLTWRAKATILAHPTTADDIRAEYEMELENAREDGDVEAISGVSNHNEIDGVNGGIGAGKGKGKSKGVVEGNGDREGQGEGREGWR